MDKLQKALKKAREQRAGLSASAQVPDAAPAEEAAAPGKPGSVVARWQALTPVEPDLAHLRANRVMTLTPCLEANPFDILRTKIQLLMRSNGWTRLAVTSPGSGCGKTTLACNLAAGFSRQREKYTMLFEMDLRRPSVSRLMGCRPQYGVEKLLTRQVTPEEQLLRFGDNVAFAMAEHAIQDPTQMLLSGQAAGMMDQLQEDYAPDTMIFDLPPMLVTDDARAMLNSVDCALIVVRADQTKMSQLDVCEREVAEYTNVLGVVLNNCRYMSMEEGYEGY
ncbi:tyrosine-protein kinase family protein [Roseobacter sp. S98]|uniref:tyrosine-protein kinase family protein n=1 Tax=Roseobacter algicola (ex Choi et al. 2025) (nom. illeg.) TaxID=3092138 RepID=UPI0035C73F12